MAVVVFPDGAEFGIDESVARHTQTGDTVALVEWTGDELRARRIGVITRRVWDFDRDDDGDKVTLVLHATNPRGPDIGPGLGLGASRVVSPT